MDMNLKGRSALVTGSTGGIGANRACARETIDSLVDDATNGRLPARKGGRSPLTSLLRRWS